MTTKPRVSRPNRAEASRRALAGIDIAAIDPVAILKTIAADPTSPAAARVSACRTLLGMSGGANDERGADTMDAVTKRAIEMMNNKPRPN